MFRSSMISLVLALGSAGSAALAANVSFTVKPVAVRSGEQVKISFTISGPTDVEVAVLDGKGEVVRHLAAGVLGGAKPPPAPLVAGLTQSIVWDNKDDFGKAVTPRDEPPAADRNGAAGAGPAGGSSLGFKVRVRAGTGVKFGRFIGDSPYNFGGIVSMAADEAGVVYIMGYGGNRNQHMRSIRAFDAEGRYLRTVMPFPADLPPEGMKDVAGWDAEAKAFRPRNLSSLNPEFYGGNLTIVSASAKKGLILSDGGSISQLDGRGGVPGAAFTLQPLWGKDRNPNTGNGPLFLAASPDGKCCYLAGPYSCKTKYGHEFNAKFPPGCVYRLRAGAGETMQPFATIPVAHTDGVGGAWTKANAYQNDGVPEGPIHGLAVDGKGNVYVCDWERGQVSVFDPGGKEIGAIKVACPHQVAVHPKTGEIYVLSRHCAGYWQYKVWVSKFKDYAAAGAAAPAAKFEFPQQKTGMPQMALVASDKQTEVYLSGVPGDFVALADNDSRFEPAKTAFAPPAGQLDVVNRIEVDKTRDEVYVSDGGNLFARFDGQTGQGGILKKDGRPFFATDLAVGYDGLLYFQTGEGFSGPLERYTRDLAPAPYSGSGTHVLSKYIYGRYGIGNCEKGIGVGPDGKVYVSWMFGGWVKYAVSGWGPDGLPLNGKGSDIDPSNHKSGTPASLTKAVIGPIPQCNGGVRVDLAGNIYVGMIVGKTPVPKRFEKNEGYTHCTGSVVKFGPGGGAVPGAADMMTGNTAQGAVAAYPGLAPFSHPHLGTTCCVCRVPRFDVDRYGRLAIPNATGNSVQLVDNAGNAILAFGKYGNFDSQYVNPNTEPGQAGKPTLAVPEIPLGWPDGAGISEKSIYALDVYNRRVVRTDLTYAAEEICAAK